MTWRDRFLVEEEELTVPMVQSVLIRFTGWGARLLSKHAEQQGKSRTEWIRYACEQQLLREGHTEVEALTPYHGKRLVRAVEREH